MPERTSRFQVKYDGLWRRMLSTTDQRDAGTAGRDVSIELLKKLINKIKGGVVNRNAFLACDPMTYFNLVLLDQVVDASKFGSNGPISRGVLAQLFGKDIVVSEYIPLTQVGGTVSNDASNNDARD